MKTEENYIKLLRWERSITNSSCVGLDDSVHVTNVLGRYSEASANTTNATVARRHVGVSAWNEQQRK